MAVFAVVFGGDPQDELVSLLQDWDKIRGLDGGDNDSDGNWFREMCGMCMPKSSSRGYV